MLNYQRELVTDPRKTKGLVINHLIEKDTHGGCVITSEIRLFVKIPNLRDIYQPAVGVYDKVEQQVLSLHELGI